MILEALKRSVGDDFKIEKITKENIQDVFHLMGDNTYYHSRIQCHEVSLEECENNITLLPPNTDIAQKFYFAFYKENKCVAVLDYVEGYPERGIVYLGLLMLSTQYQGQGLGRQLVESLLKSAKENHFKETKLACYEANEKGYAFWKSMGFEVEGEVERETDGQKYKLWRMSIKL